MFTTRPDHTTLATSPNLPHTASTDRAQTVEFRTGDAETVVATLLGSIIGDQLARSLAGAGDLLEVSAGTRVIKRTRCTHGTYLALRGTYEFQIGDRRLQRPAIWTYGAARPGERTPRADVVAQTDALLLVVDPRNAELAGLPADWAIEHALR